MQAAGSCFRLLASLAASPVVVSVLVHASCLDLCLPRYACRSRSRECASAAETQEEGLEAPAPSSETIRVVRFRDLRAQPPWGTETGDGGLVLEGGEYEEGVCAGFVYYWVGQLRGW